MSLLARVPLRALPLLRRAALARLMGATARAFQRPRPALRGLGTEEVLARYASFTAEQAQRALREGQDLPALQARLYSEAYTLGRWCGRLCRVRTMAGAMAAGRALYRCLEIDFRGDEQGQVTISRCYFSRLYTPTVCRVMSAMDHGLLSGLLGGAQFDFQARLSEGAPCCLARLSPIRQVSRLAPPA